MKKYILTITGLLFGGLLGFYMLNRIHLNSFPYIISAFYSKEFCSCYFVMNRSEPQCHNFARQWIPVSEFQLDEQNKTVSVKGLGITTKVEFVSKEFGCRFQASPPL
jgi:hypothetical protein